MSLYLDTLKQDAAATLAQFCRELKQPFDDGEVRYVVSPYRISPIGAHIDHQGGAVLGRTIDQYTVLAFVVGKSAEITLRNTNALAPLTTNFSPLDPLDEEGWQRYAQAATAAFHAKHLIKYGITGIVHGTLLGAGLSSSASVILAYLHALADANAVTLSAAEYVELARQVENEYLGLNNGIQDQTAISFGAANALLHMNVRQRVVQPVADPPNVNEVSWLLAYSGFSRELLGSGFNTRVAECREAAALLDSSATVLGDVDYRQRSDAALNQLPDMLARRARHFFGEIGRVDAGKQAWAGGDWDGFGRMMNQSCQSSIHLYESGSEPLVALQKIALQTDGVYGSRFSGGGYGGCLIMLVERVQAAAIQEQILQAYLQVYPEKQGIAKVFEVVGEDAVRVERR